MKFHLLLIGLVVSSISGAYWFGKKQSLPFAVINVQKIVSQTAERIAIKNLTPEQNQREMAQFKQSLQESLKNFAQQNRLLIIPSHSLFGEASDQTANFIRFYNEEPSA